MSLTSDLRLERSRHSDSTGGRRWLPTTAATGRT